MCLEWEFMVLTQAGHGQRYDWYHSEVLQMQSSAAQHLIERQTVSQSCQFQGYRVQSATQLWDFASSRCIHWYKAITFNHKCHSAMALWMHLTAAKAERRMQIHIPKGTKGAWSAACPHYHQIRIGWPAVITKSLQTQSEIDSHLHCHLVSIQVRMLWIE